MRLSFCTGFNHLAYHSLNKGDITNDECRLCGEESEQAWHLADECAALGAKRMEIFGENGVPSDWTVGRLIELLRVPALERIITTRVDSPDGDPDWWRADES